MKLDEIEKKVNAMVDERSSEITNLENQIEDEKAAIEEARAEMDAAADVNDLEGYQRAKHGLADAADAAEMHQAKLDKLETTPAISSEEYAQLKADTIAAMNTIVESSKPELKEETERLAAIGDKVADEAKRTTAILQKIQRDLRLDDGTALEYTAHRDVCMWAQRASQSGTYQEFTGRRH